MFAHNGAEKSSACFTLRPVGRLRARTRHPLPAAKRETRKWGDAEAEHLGLSIVNVRGTDSSEIQSSTHCGIEEDNNTMLSLNRRDLFGDGKTPTFG